MADKGSSKNRSIIFSSLIGAAVTIAFFTLLEIGARLYNLPSRLQPEGGTPKFVEMPTWMLRDANTRERAARMSVDAAVLDWLALFEEGDRFRVRLTPSTSKLIFNTFGLTKADKLFPYLVTSNSLGFRGPELPAEKAPHAFRIVIFGDSSSFGWGVNYEDSFAEIIRSDLQALAPSKKIEVANFAMPGDSSEYGRLIFERFAPLVSADMFIFGFGANDAKRVSAAHQPQVQAFRQSLNKIALRKTLERSALFAALSRSVDGWLVKTPEVTSNKTQARVAAVPKKRFRENLEALITQGAQYGARNSAVLSLCTPGDYARAAEKVARRNSALYFNGQAFLLEALPQVKAGKLLPELASEILETDSESIKNNSLLYVSSDGCHPNKIGHKLVGAQLTRLIFNAALAAQN